MAPIDPARLPRVSALFDEVEELTPEARALRIAELKRNEPEAAAELLRWLARDRQVEGLLDGLTGSQPAPGKIPIDESGDRSGQAIGPYQLLRRVGRGGMGEVYEARRPVADFEQRVAIKLLRRGLDSEDVIRRFLRERRILAQLEHPGIARLIDGGMSEDGLPYLVMEFVTGEGLLDAVNKQDLDIESRLHLFLHICDAVAYAHRRLIVHRDIKPSNVLLSTDNEPKLLDFGIAKLLDEVDEEALTGTGMRVLTPAYAAPEQILGQPISTATDVYSLGLILYELLTGSTPLQRSGKNLERVAHDLEQESVLRPSSAVLASGAPPSVTQASRQRRARRLSGDLDTIVLHALKREPERRYQGAAELAEDIRRHLNGHPVRAEADTIRYRLGKFVQRHRGGVTAAALALLGIIAGLVVALWQADIARRQAAIAQTQLQRAEAIKEFTLSLFREQDPLARGKPEPRSANELIAVGIARARTQFSDDPAQRSELLNDLGEVLVSLGDFSAAAPVLEEARAEQAGRAGPHSAAHAQTQANLAAARLGLGETTVAIELLEQSIDVLVGTSGADSAMALKVRAQMVKALFASGRVDEAVTLARALLPAHEQLFGPNAAPTIARLADITMLLEQSDQLEAAESAAQSLVMRVEGAYGADSILLIRPLTLLGDLHRRRQQYPAADASYARALALARAHRHPGMSARVLGRRGDLLRRMQRLDEAAAHFDEAASLLPDTSPERGQIELWRAGLARTQGDMRRASAGFLKAFEIFRGALGDESVFAWNAALEYANTERMAGTGSVAEPLLLQAVETLRRIAKPQSFDLMLATGTLAQWRAAQGRHAEASLLFAESIAIGDTVYGPGHPTNVLTRLAHAESLIAIGSADSMRLAKSEIDATLASDSEAQPLAEESRSQANRLLAKYFSTSID